MDSTKRIILVNPKTFRVLTLEGDYLKDEEGNTFPIVKNVPRFVSEENYSNSFGFQWNKFDRIQLDGNYLNLNLSKDRFFAETGWSQTELEGLNILEVGCGAGRFTEVILKHTKANIFSVDYSDAVSANYKNNKCIDPNRYKIFQASVYELPFMEETFDRVFCFGVLQHTPDFEQSIKAMIKKTKIGGEIVVDFYPINGWWSKIHAKYIFRPFLKKVSHERLLAFIERHVDKCIKINVLLRKVGLKTLCRFVPICDVLDVYPKDLSASQLRELTVLDTFDQYSPAHDHPQRIKTVCKMFEKNGAEVTFHGRIKYAENGLATVVRGIRRL